MVDAVTTKQEVGNLRDHQPDGDTTLLVSAAVGTYLGSR